MDQGSVGLLEREQELGRIDAALGAATAGSGRTVVIEGVAGIGKSRLLARAVEAAEDRDLVVLKARARELESGFAFGVVRQLLERPFRDADEGRRAALLAGAARLAEPLVAPDASAQGEAVGDTGGSNFPLLHGLYWTLANLADEGPVLVTIDDAHWADTASLGFLAFLAPRLAELPVLLALTARPRGPRASALLDELIVEPTAEVLRPRPLSSAAISDLATSAMRAPVDEQFAAACREVTGGNPFLLEGLLSELAEEEVDPIAAAAPRVLALGPEAVGRAVLADLARLGPAAVPLAQATAVLEEGRLEDAAQLAGVGIGEARTAADELAAAGILAGGLSLRFRHALVRNAIYGDLHAQARAAMHRRAAALLSEATDGSDAAAAHLMRCAPAADPEAVRLLLAAARGAMRRGSPEAAAVLGQRAVAESPPSEVQGELLWTLAQAEALSGSDAAIGRYEDAIPRLADIAARSEATRELAAIYAMQAGTGQQDRAIAVLEAGLEGLGEDELEFRVALECDSVCFARIGTGGGPRVGAHVERLRGLADADWAAGSPIGRRVLVRAAYDATLASEPALVASELLGRALADGRFIEDEPVESAHFPIAAMSLMAADDFAAAETLLDAGIADAQRRGSAVGFSQGSGYRAMVALRRGALAEAEADARAGLAAARPPESAPLLLACMIDALLEQGQIADAEALLAEHGVGEASGQTHFFLHLLEARGRLRLAGGDPERALGDLVEAVRIQGLLEINNPAVIASHSAAARAQLALGRREPARELALAELERARAFGVPRALGVSLTTLGLTEAGDAGIERLGEAVATLAGSGAVLEHARAEVELGSALRRAGRRIEAREHLRPGLEGAERCGAVPLARRAHEELLATGARPRRAMLSGVSALTASELRVARMAAAGMSNPEIAQSLFVTRKTIEVHLSNCYRKLGIASREDLGVALAEV
jgi:DNA-binding CsgD family transcriptional regulator